MKDTINEVLFYDEAGQILIDQEDAELHIHEAMLSILHENNILNDRVFSAAMENISKKGVMLNE